MQSPLRSTIPNGHRNTMGKKIYKFAKKFSYTSKLEYLILNRNFLTKEFLKTVLH